MTESGAPEEAAGRRAQPEPLRLLSEGPAYVELGCATAFSFLRGASRAHELVGQAWELGHAAVGVADLNTLAGVVRMHAAAQDMALTLNLDPDKDVIPPPFRLCVGTRLAFITNGDLWVPDVLVYPSDREAFARLTGLLTKGGMEAGIKKGEARIAFDDLLAHAQGQNMILMPSDRPDPDELRGWADRLLEASGGRAWLAGTRRYDAVDEMRLDLVAEVAVSTAAPLIAVGDVVMHHPSRKRLLDVMTCIREHTTLFEAGRRLELNAERHLKDPAEMARLFEEHPDAIAQTVRFAQACDFSLKELAYQYPEEPVPPGKTAQQHLAHLARGGLEKRWPIKTKRKVEARRQLKKELKFIEKMGYAHYFLTVHDIVKWARAQGILCQGRGSAANSVVCYCLFVTAIDPITHKLLFSRFISSNRHEPPDIDVDFEHERRELVIQRMYEKYGRHRAAICATVIHYRPRMAIREVGKVFGLSEDATGALASTVWGSWGDALPDAHVRQAGLDPENVHLREVLALANELIGFPRHLSQHVGGFVLTQRPLSEICPIVNAAMPDRTFIEWDKDDIDALGIMKVDILALGMLTALKKGFDMLEARGAIPAGFDMADLPDEQPDVYRMCAEGDTVGVFQIESRAQMNMLPRLRPETFYDLVIEVAIVRPGPIQGDMVHPYLKRKSGAEPIVYPRPGPGFPQNELEEVLSKTLGVPLFQEQVMRVAMVAAEFSGAEADGLRRAMATFKRAGGMGRFEQKLVDGMARRGYAPHFAAQIFKQIEGFGSYGFPESHAASFAKLVYVSAWLKCRFPAVFCVALLNSQPMGFYAPAQLVRDAVEHGVEVRPIDVEHSDWDSTIERDNEDNMVVRLGLRMIDGMSEKWAQVIPGLRGEGFGDFDVFMRRTNLTRAQVRRLADADAFQSFKTSRRGGFWQSLKTDRKAAPPLLASLPKFTPAPALPDFSRSEEVVADYRTTRLSLKGHPMEFLRPTFAAQKARPCGDLVGMRDSQPVSVAGVCLVRQRPGNGNVCFITIEDETGVANLVVVMEVFERYRGVIMSSRLLFAHGRIQKSPEGVTHVFVHKLEDRSDELSHLTEADAPAFQPAIAPSDHVLTNGPTGSGATKLQSLGPVPLKEPDRRAQRGHPRDVRIISRDFH